MPVKNVIIINSESSESSDDGDGQDNIEGKFNMHSYTIYLNFLVSILKLD